MLHRFISNYRVPFRCVCQGKGEGIRYYERQASGEYLELTDTNPFKGIYCTDFSTPEVVDWDGDGHLDLIASAGSIGDALAGGSIRPKNL